MSKVIAQIALTILVSGCLFFNTSQAKEKREWISIGSDAVRLINHQYSHLIELNVIQQFDRNGQVVISSKSYSNNDNVSIVNVKASEINAISRLMHKEFNRCAGFVFHPTLDNAIKYAKGSFIKSPNKVAELTINNGLTVEALLAQLNEDNLSSTVNNLSNYNNRYFDVQSGVDAATWVKDEWTNIASTRTDISVEFFQHASWQQPSVIATITGSTNPEEIIIIGGHLDSINGSSPTTGRAPGADDNASGIAVITETLLAFVGSDYKPARTIKLMGYAAEEVGLRGSDAIAAQYSSEGLNVIGVAQFDMTGFHGTSDQDITFISDFTDDPQNQYMTQLIDTYLSDVTYGFDLCGYACSDHASWNRRGFPASFPFESTFRDDNKTIHTANDSTFDSAHAFNFLKLAVIYAAEMAKGDTGDSSSITSVQFSTQDIHVNEGNSVTVSVQRNGNIDSQISIDFATVNGTAIAGTDFTAINGTLNWDAQDRADKSISISIGNLDSDKSFTVVLSNPQGNAEVGLSDTLTVNIKALIQNDNGGVSSNGGGGSSSYILLCLVLLVGGFKRK